ncbi:MAG: ECF-type sigma factor [Candidatus Solibacter sp.]
MGTPVGIEIPSGEVTLMLQRLGVEKDGWGELIPVIYSELRAIAAGCLRYENSTSTLQPTALVHEAYLRLRGQRSMEWQDRHHFFGVAAHLMRMIVVDHARRSRVRDRGDGVPPRELAGDLHFYDALDQAMERLAAFDQRQARVVELRFFGGLNVEETALVLNVSPKTVKREWAVARAWLHGELKHPDERHRLGTS